MEPSAGPSNLMKYRNQEHGQKSHLEFLLWSWKQKKNVDFPSRACSASSTKYQKVADMNAHDAEVDNALRTIISALGLLVPWIPEMLGSRL